jgi:hypothetical protein
VLHRECCFKDSIGPKQFESILKTVSNGRGRAVAIGQSSSNNELPARNALADGMPPEVGVRLGVFARN